VVAFNVVTIFASWRILDAMSHKALSENLDRGMGFQPMLAGGGVKDTQDSKKFPGCGPSTGWKPVPQLAFSDRASSFAICN
jgi:hypothetical protein